MTTWETYNLGDLATVRGGKRLPLGSQLTADENDHPYIRVRDMVNRTVPIGDLLFVPHEVFPSISRYIVKTDDIIISIVGTIGLISIIDTDLDNASLTENCAKLIYDKGKLDRDFLYYFLISGEGQEEIKRGIVGSTQPKLPFYNIQKIRLPLPPIEEQKAIATILSAFDDKIELNRRMNVTLEAMARALFKAWFVDFEPVHANKEKRPSTSSSPEIAQLFPSDFENGIPKGWRQITLNEACEVNPLRSLRKGAIAKYLDMASVPTVGHRVSGVRDRVFTSGAKFKNGDTLLARITPCLENGKTAFVDFLSEDEIGWGSTEFIVLRPKNRMPYYFAYLLCRTDEFRSFAIQSMTGTSGRQRVQVDSITRFSLAIPSSDSAIGEKFGILTSPMVEKIKQNSEEIFSLAQIRDSLLPRLISGRLRVGSN